MSLSGIPTLKNLSGGDPRLQASGMTSYLMSGSRLTYKEEALNKGSFRAPLRFGFTLIELLVVVLIIGILAAIALPQYQKAVAKTRYASLKHMTKAIALAQEVYYLTNGEYSTNIEDLDIQWPESTSEFQLNPGETEEEGAVRSKRVRTYTWGNCWTNLGKCVCINNDIGMEYQIYPSHPHDNSPKNSIWCVARNNIAHQICKDETGRTTPSYGTTMYQYK